MKLWEVDIVELLVPQVDVRLNLLPFGKHNGVDVICFEDKHPPFSAPVCNNSVFFFNETHEMSESNLHAFVNNLFDRDQILGDYRNMQDVPHYPLL